MEITINRRVLYTLSTLLAVGLLVALAALGRAHTPMPARLIGPVDWEAGKVERRYGRELSRLRQDLQGLAHMLAGRPDPVRADLAAARLAQRHSGGLDLLAREREVVVGAALAVRDWAAGYESLAHATAAVNAAMEVLEEEMGHTPESGGDDDDRNERRWLEPTGQQE